MNNSAPLTDEEKQEMLKHKKYEKETIVETYNELSENYERVYIRAGYHDPLRCADLTKEIIGEQVETASVFDMGCGTGLVGQYLKERGFKTIVGVDASIGMIEKAREKEAYAELEELFLGQPETFPAKYHNRFDAVTAVGILAEGHLDNKVFDEMLLALKTGGYAIFATRTMYLTEYSYGERIKELEE